MNKASRLLALVTESKSKDDLDKDLNEDLDESPNENLDSLGDTEKKAPSKASDLIHQLTSVSDTSSLDEKPE